MKHALVTGGAGFIGSHVVDRLLSDGWKVTAVDNFDEFYDPAIKEANIEAHRCHPNYAIIRADIRDTTHILDSIKGRLDAIVHLAAKPGVRPSILNPVECQTVNVGGTQSVLEIARATGAGQFIFGSSSSVYGVNPNVPWREDDLALRPISPYASTKISGELMGHVYSHLYGIRFIALRFFTVYGPRQRPDLAIHKLARRMLEGRSVPMYGDGTTRRDYTYVDDIVDGIVAALNYRGSMYEIVNLGNNRTVSLREMIAALEQTLGCKANIEQLPEQAGDVPQTWADLRRARRLLNYQPRTPFLDGLARFAEWLKTRMETQKVVCSLPEATLP